MITQFPPVEFADPESGLLAVGGDLEVGSLLLAYRSGIFPWPVREAEILWFAPAVRAIIDFEDFRIPRRLQRHLKTLKFAFFINRDFPSVIRSCAESKNRRRQAGTWITSQMIQAYIDFHKAGYAHSFEVYNRQDKLAGGLYGVRIGHFFAGESMFYRETHASKFALIHTVSFLKKQGISWMDIQMLTPLLESFGAKEISREDYQARLKHALRPGRGLGA